MIHRHARRAWRPLALEPLELRALLATSAGIAPDAATVRALAPVTPTAETRLLVQFQPSASAGQVGAAVAAVGGRVAATYPTGLREVRFDGAQAANVALRAFDASPLVQFAQANSTIHASAAVYPNDPGDSSLWSLNNANDVDIDAPEAWGITTGSPSIIVAVLDTGIDLSNPDFAGRIWTNPGNDAAAGYPNDIHGWNFVAGNNNVQDNDGHGTHVASILGATGNNGYGVAGVAWNVQIMPLKFLDSNGDGDTANAVAAIYYAVDHGARVINASWGGLGYNQALVQAISYADAHNVVFVAAAGNGVKVTRDNVTTNVGVDDDLFPSYPASFNLPNELSVTAIDQDGNLPSFADFGASTVNIAAPGVNILGDYPTAFSASGVQFLSGTSMATAYVSGVAALLLSQHPEYTAEQVVQVLDATAKPLPSLAGRTISGGMVDAYNALAANPTTVTSTGTTPPATPVTPTPSVGDAQVQAFILSSDEYYAAHGGTAAGFVTALYQQVLGRTPDPGGLAYWSSLGATTAASRATVVQAILDSDEGRATLVAGWYQSDLGRAAPLAALKADPGVRIWVQYLDAGVTPEAVEAAILASPEYLVGHGASPVPVVSAWYGSILGRTADPGGLTAWSNQLWAGDAPFAVIRQLQNTPEARQARVARWFAAYLGRTSGLDALKADPGVDALAGLLTI